MPMKFDGVDLKSEKLIPFQFQILEIVFLVSGFIILPGFTIAIHFLLIISAALVTGNRGIEFNISDKSYRTYNSFIFLKFSKWEEHENGDGETGTIISII